jgi:hypothetical protein
MTMVDKQFLVSMLTLCGKNKALKMGKEIHQVAREQNFVEGSVVTSLISMYTKCDSIGDAEQVSLYIVFTPFFFLTRYQGILLYS